MTENEFTYGAFLSYSQQDNAGQRPAAPDAAHICWGDWLREELETFSVPAAFAGQPNARAEIVPASLAPVFQDTEEQPGNAALSDPVRQALEKSKCLVVLCSPRSATSLHVNEVVRYFKQLGRGHRIFSLVIAGEPNAGDATRPDVSLDDECFCPALRHPLKPDGTIDTSRERGSIFADARHGDAKQEMSALDQQNSRLELETGKLQLIAGLLGVGFNGLWGHELKRRFAETKSPAHSQIQEAATPAPAVPSVAVPSADFKTQNQLQAAQQQIQELRHQAQEAESKVLAAQTEAREALGQIAEARQQAQAAEIKVAEAQEVARATQSQLEAARTQVRDAQNKVLEVQNLPQDVKSQIQDAQNQLLEAQSQARTAQSQIEEARNQARDAQTKLAAAQNQSREIQNQVRAIEAKASQTQTQLDEARNRSGTAESKLLEAQTQAREAQNQIESSRQKAREAQGKIQELQNQSRDALSQLQAAQSKVLEMQNQTRTTQNEVQESQTKIQAARRLTKVFAFLAVLAIAAASLAVWQRKLASQTPPVPVAATNAPVLASASLDQEQIQQALRVIASAGQGADQQRSLDELAAQVPTGEISATLSNSSVILSDPQLSYFQGQLLDTWSKTNATAAFDWTCQLTNADFRQLALEKIVPLVAADNPTNTLARLNDLQLAPGAEAYTSLFQSWAAIDPVQALDCRQQVPGHDADFEILSAIMTVWGAQKPDAALNWLQSQPDSEALPAGIWRDRIIADLFDTWAAKDLAAATTACQQLPDGSAKEKAWASVLSQRIEKDPASAAEYVTNLPAGDARQNALEALCNGWNGTNALAWAQSLPAGEERTNTINQIVASWAHKDPASAVQATNVLADLYESTVFDIATAWFPRDFPATTNWIAGLPEGDQKETALVALAKPWSEKDPHGMAAYTRTLPAGDTQTRYLTAVCPQLAIQDFPAAVELLQPWTDPVLRQSILMQSAQKCDVPYLNRTAQYIAAMPAGDDQTAAIRGLLSTWTAVDPAAAVNWLTSFSQTNAQPDFIQQVVGSWSQSEPAAVAKWLTNAPAATINDATTNAFIDGAVIKYPAFAAQWTASVPDETKRQAYQLQIARQWLKTDPSAAQQWIDTLNLPDDIKQPLKNESP